MTISPEMLGQRLRAARQAVGLRQSDVAEKLGFDRANLSQIENGVRAPTSIQLSIMADLYGRSMESLLREGEFQGGEALSVLFRAEPSFNDDGRLNDSIRRVVKIFEETTNLEEQLGIRSAHERIPDYGLHPPDNKREAVEQGKWLAQQERRRLDLGEAPIFDVVDILVKEGIRAGSLDLPDPISGMMLWDKEVGAGIVVNSKQALARRRFSLAHEYCHVLADRRSYGMVSKIGQRTPVETRANTFAAYFLMPDQAIESKLDSMGAGKNIGLHHVVEIAYYFGTSYESAFWQLVSTGHLSRNCRDEFLDDSAQDFARSLLRTRADVDADDESGPNHTCSRWFHSLVYDAYGRGKISRSKARELLELVGVPSGTADAILDHFVPADDDGSPVLIPEMDG